MKCINLISPRAIIPSDVLEKIEVLETEEIQYILNTQAKRYVELEREIAIDTRRNRAAWGKAIEKAFVKVIK